METVILGIKLFLIFNELVLLYYIDKYRRRVL